MQKRIFLPVEVFSREIDSRICLAAFFQSKGYEVIFGHIWYVKTIALKFASEGDIYFQIHAKRSFGDEWLDVLKERGVFLIGIEEEGPFDYIDYAIQDQERGTQSGVGIFDIWICWGNRDFNYLKNKLPELPSLLNYGTPRSSLWGICGEKYYLPELNSRKIRQYGNFVLIATSFWKTFAVNDTTTTIKLTKAYGEVYKNMVIKTLGDEEKNRIEEENNFINLEKLILAIIFETNFNVVIRPYPMERDILAKKLKKINNKRVFIDRSLSISPLIKSCKAFIHSGSTTAIESLVSEKPTISIIDFNTHHESNSNLLSVQLSKKPKTKKELLRDLESPNTLDLSNYLVKSNLLMHFEKLYEKIIELSNYKELNFNKKRIIANKSRKIYNAVIKIRGGKVYKTDKAKRPKLDSQTISTKLEMAYDVLDIKNPVYTIDLVDQNTFYLHI